MGEITRTEVEQVEKEVSIKVCDYCQLMTEEMLDDDEEFNTMLLNPTIKTNRMSSHYNDMFRHQANTVAKTIIKTIDVANAVNENQDEIQDVTDIVINEDPYEMDEAKLENRIQEMMVAAFMDAFNRWVSFDSSDTADLCPGCTDDLFGDGPATGIRRGTGYLESIN